MKKVPAVILLVLGYLSVTAYANNCYSGIYEEVDCPIETAHYTGPPAEIVNGKPTLPADVSFDQTATVDATLDVVTGAIGSIPEVGSILSGYFTAFRTMFHQQSINQALEELYQALSKEVDALIDYVDEMVLELQVSDIRNDLGGLESAALDCYNLYTDYPDDMKTCLIGVRSDILVFEDYFFPYLSSHPSPEEAFNQGPLLEQLIPMWRHYCDLSIVVTLELIVTIRTSGEEDEATQLIDELPQMLTKFLDFWNKAKALLEFHNIGIHDQSTFEARQCHLYQGNTCAFTSYTYDTCEFSATFGPQGSSVHCKTEIKVGCLNHESWSYARSRGEDLFWDNAYSWRDVRGQEVNVYYYNQLERTTDLWKRMLDRLDQPFKDRQTKVKSTGWQYLTRRLEKTKIEVNIMEHNGSSPNKKTSGMFQSRKYYPAPKTELVRYLKDGLAPGRCSLHKNCEDVHVWVSICSPSGEIIICEGFCYKHPEITMPNMCEDL